MLTIHAAHAQDVSPSPVVGTPFDRQRTVAVADRAQPGYEEVGTRAGGFVLFPRVRITAAYDDNVRAQPSGFTNGPRGDAAVMVEPSIRAVSDWTRHQLGASALVNVTRFARLDTESTETYALRGEGRYDAGDEVRLYGFAGYRRDIERRTAPGALRNSVRPATFRTAAAGAQLTWQGNRLRLAASGSAARVEYEDVRTFDGVLFSSRELDRTRYQAGLRADYAITADLAVLVSGTASKIDFNPPAAAITPDRSARRAELLAGISFEFTDLLRGEMAIGYITQDFRSDAIRGFSGLGGRAQVTYFPTRLTTVTLDAARTLEEAGNPLAPSFRRTRIGLRADHELFRYVLLSAFADHEDNRFQLPLRSERRWHAGLAGQYLVDRHVALFGRYDHLRITTRPSDIGLRLTDNVITVGVLLKP